MNSKETDQSYIEDHVQGDTITGSGSLEHDPTSVYFETPQVFCTISFCFDALRLVFF